jgi:hypothetical protein
VRTAPAPLASGGGQVDTGGGFVAKARMGLDYDLTPSLKLGLEGGRIESAGSFSANFYGLSLGYRLGEVGAGERGHDWQSVDEVRLAKWRLAGVQHTSFDAARKSGSDQDLSLIGLKIEKFDRFFDWPGPRYTRWRLCHRIDRRWLEIPCVRCV